MNARQRVGITGSSGLIGGALSAFLTDRGDEVVHVVRREPRTHAEIRWVPGQRLDPAALDGVDVVVNLAGPNIGARRWTRAYKAELRDARVAATTTISQAIADSGGAARLLSASAVGWYGDRGEEVLTEQSPRGEGFLSDLCRDWEDATGAAAQAGSPVALLRTGLVLAPGEGAMGPLLKLAPLGLAGPLGDGRQWWPWITLHDHVRAVAHLIDDPTVTGPVNLVGPSPARQREVTAELGRQLHRPARLPAPAPAMRLALGEFSRDVLASQRVMPGVLAGSGFEFEHADLPAAIAWVLAQR
ncbi:MAG: TIGR01777 family oxidoreductase [Micrococcales bacterium]|nr:TIGR01777 family oxidoreductase [Micrococcales bacterium]